MKKEKALYGIIGCLMAEACDAHMTLFVGWHVT